MTSTSALWAYAVLCLVCHTARRVTGRAPGRSLASLIWDLRRHPVFTRHPVAYRLLMRPWPCALLLTLVLWLLLVAAGPPEVAWRLTHRLRRRFWGLVNQYYDRKYGSTAAPAEREWEQP